MRRENYCILSRSIVRKASKFHFPERLLFIYKINFTVIRSHIVQFLLRFEKIHIF